MKNGICKDFGSSLLKELDSFLNKNGKNGCIALGLCLLYAVSRNAMDKEYSVDFSMSRENGISLKLSPSTTTD